jgi:hypothetical protein
MTSSPARRRPRRLQPLLAAMLAVVACPGTAPAQSESIVYYQVSYGNGTIRDLSTVPATNKGIEKVLRISRIEGPDSGLSILSTSGRGGTFIKTGRTISRELRWDGRAWVGEADLGKAPGPTASHPADPSRQKRRQELIRQLQDTLKAEQQHQQISEKAIIQAAELLAKAKGTDGEKPAMLLLERAQAARQESLERTLNLERLLSELTTRQAGPPGSETGKVTPAGPGRLAKGDFGVVRPIAGRRVLPHRVQVWPLPPGRGRRNYTVAMAHPEAGPVGAFHYVAYSDADGDGVPDTLIARSPPAVARTPGGWTRWDFETAAETVFIGNAWSQDDAVHYYGTGDDAPHNWQGPGTDVYVSGWPGGPFHKWGRPYLTNIRVHVGKQIPD